MSVRRSTAGSRIGFLQLLGYAVLLVLGYCAWFVAFVLG